MLAHRLKSVEIYAGVSYRGNRGPGGWAAILVYQGMAREFSGSEMRTTKSRIELRAVIEGLRRLKEPCGVSLSCGSRYIVSAFNDNRLEEWQDRGWLQASGSRVVNRDLWHELLDEYAKHDVRWIWVGRRGDSAYGKRCRTLAVRACKASFTDG
jgi:ribonuclease HI